MSYDALEALRKLRKTARAHGHSERLSHGGHSPSEIDDALQQVWDQKFPPDSIAVEMTRHFTVFLRSLYAQRHDGFRCVITPDDSCDHVAGGAYIDSCYNEDDSGRDTAKLCIRVRPGPTSWQKGMALGDLKHYDLFGSGARTYMTLVPGTIRIDLTHPAAAVTTRHADHIRDAMFALRREIRFRSKIHSIDNVVVGGYEPNNELYNRKLPNGTVSLNSVTFTYFYTKTSRVQHRVGVYEAARAVWTSIIRASAGDSGEPRIDGRGDGEVEWDTDAVVYGVPPLDDVP